MLFFWVGQLFDRHGAGKVVLVGTVAMACGTVLLALVTRPWGVYAAFAVMSAGWATMSGAAINIIVAPWFDRRRGLALSWALNGASAGGIIIVPLLTFLIARFGFAVAIGLAAAPVSWLPRPPAETAPRGWHITALPREFWRMLRGDRVLVGLLVCAVSYMVMLGGLRPFLFWANREWFGAADTAWTGLMAAQGAGAVIGALAGDNYVRIDLLDANEVR